MPPEPVSGWASWVDCGGVADLLRWWVMTTDEIREVVPRYLARYPQETERLAPLVAALDTGTDVTSRHEMRGGHVTCGAAVIDDMGQLLLIRHAALNRWLLPGGHVEPSDTGLLYAALRELEEETGIPWRLTVSPPGQDVCPVDIDVHAIPANAAKNEPAHWHADFRYSFWVKSPQVRLQLEEVTDYAWRPLAEAPTEVLAGKLACL